MIHIGQIVATFGLKGEVILSHALGHKTTLNGVTVLFIEEHKGSFLPYFIQSSKAKNETEIYVKLEGLESKEAATRILQKKTLLQQEDFRKLANVSSPIALLGFQIITDEEEVLGVVEEVIEQPHQVLLKITYKEKEALIPLHGETLDKIDTKKQIVYVTLPDGLLDIYQ